MDDILKILIIEDDSTIRSILSYVLSQKGFEVSDCMMLRDAAALLAAEAFDLIISDIGLPDGNGLDFCSQHKKIPFIVMSGMECSELAKASGASRGSLQLWPHGNVKDTPVQSQLER